MHSVFFSFRTFYIIDEQKKLHIEAFDRGLSSLNPASINSKVGIAENADDGRGKNHKKV
jgi:hypothetical protein